MSNPLPFLYNYPTIDPSLTQLDLHNQGQLQDSSNNGLHQPQFQTVSSSNAIDGLVISQQEQGGDEGFVPWNGQMSSLGPHILPHTQQQQPEQDQIPVHSFDQLQSMWINEVSSPQQPYYEAISQPPISPCGPQSQYNFSFRPPLQPSYLNLSSQSPAPTVPRVPSTSGGVENDSPKAPLPKKLKNPRSEPRPEGSSIPPPPIPSALKWQGKGVMSNTSQSAVLSSSVPPLDAPTGSNKRRRDEGPLEGFYKRAKMAVPPPRPIPLPQVPMTHVIDCPKSSGQDYCCAGCLRRKTNRLWRMDQVKSYMTDLCLRGMSITQELDTKIPIPGLNIRHVWSLIELVPFIGFEGVFHLANCFVLDQVTGYRYWWPNYNNIGPESWPARFLAIPCPPELILHWSVINLIRVYQAGYNVSFHVIVAYYRNMGNIPADIPPHRRLSFEQPIIVSGPASGHVPVNADDIYQSILGNGHVDQFDNSDSNNDNAVSVPDWGYWPQTVQSQHESATEPTEQTTDVAVFDYGNVSTTEPAFSWGEENEATSAGALIASIRDNFSQSSTLDSTYPDDAPSPGSAIAFAYLIDSMSDVLYSSQGASS